MSFTLPLFINFTIVLFIIWVRCIVARPIFDLNVKISSDEMYAEWLRKA